jgi:hypothetical protein
MPRIKNTIEHNGKHLVCRIFDNGGAAVDRYTIAFKACKVNNIFTIYPYLASSVNPFHPQGIKRVAFDSLPADVQKFILNNI